MYRTENISTFDKQCLNEIGNKVIDEQTRTYNAYYFHLILIRLFSESLGSSSSFTVLLKIELSLSDRRGRNYHIHFIMDYEQIQRKNEYATYTFGIFLASKVFNFLMFMCFIFLYQLFHYI